MTLPFLCFLWQQLSLFGGSFCRVLVVMLRSLIVCAFCLSFPVAACFAIGHSKEEMIHGIGMQREKKINFPFSTREEEPKPTHEISPDRVIARQV